MLKSSAMTKEKNDQEEILFYPLNWWFLRRRRSELGMGAFTKESTTGLKSKTNHKTFVKPVCEESCFRHNVMPSLLSGIWGPFPCFWQINISCRDMICSYSREYERYIYYLGLDVRTINWNYIIDEVIRRSQYELAYQRKVYIKNLPSESVFNLRNMTYMKGRKWKRIIIIKVNIKWGHPKQERNLITSPSYLSYKFSLSFFLFNLNVNLPSNSGTWLIQQKFISVLNLLWLTLLKVFLGKCPISVWLLECFCIEI